MHTMYNVFHMSPSSQLGSVRSVSALPIFYFCFTPLTTLWKVCRWQRAFCQHFLGAAPWALLNLDFSPITNSPACLGLTQVCFSCYYFRFTLWYALFQLVLLPYKISMFFGIFLYAWSTSSVWKHSSGSTLICKWLSHGFFDVYTSTACVLLPVMTTG